MRDGTTPRTMAMRFQYSARSYPERGWNRRLARRWSRRLSSRSRRIAGFVSPGGFPPFGLTTMPPHAFTNCGSGLVSAGLDVSCDGRPASSRLRQGRTFAFARLTRNRGRRPALSFEAADVAAQRQEIYTQYQRAPMCIGIGHARLFPTGSPALIGVLGRHVWYDCRSRDRMTDAGPPQPSASGCVLLGPPHMFGRAM
jgi:hypothetical protein